MKKKLLVIFLLFGYTLLKAQPAQDSVKTVINKMFTAMKSSDSISLKECFTTNARMQTFRRGQLVNETVQDFAIAVAKMPKDSADEQITFETVQIDGPMASVWTPYKFYYNNKFSHCGVNHFVLARIEGIWKIEYIIDTRRRIGCDK